MDMDEMDFYSLDEQAIKQEIAYKKRKSSYSRCIVFLGLYAQKIVC